MFYQSLTNNVILDFIERTGDSNKYCAEIDTQSYDKLVCNHTETIRPIVGFVAGLIGVAAIIYAINRYYKD